MNDRWCIEQGPPGQDEIFIRVRQIAADKWIAEISAGWWVAQGNNKDAAIRAVKKRYEDETNKLTLWDLDQPERGAG
ncbi:hypothetical protein ACFLXI_05185 [Chloroflexota bacterium]